MRSIQRARVIVLLPLLLLVSCSTDDPASSDNDGRILLNRDLGGRITTFPNGVDMPVDDDAEWSSSVQVSSSRIASRQTSFTEGVLVLMLRAEVDPPALDGVEMRATHVQVDGDRAYVTYNREGETFLGGVEVFDVSSPAAPSLLSQAIFTDTDVSAVYVHDSKLYLAEATSDESYNTPAILEVLELDGDGLLTTTSERVDLPSYVATGVRVAAQGESASVYVTSGTGGPVPGGLSIYDASTLSELEMVELDDARDVDVEGNAVVVMQGTPGRLKVFDATTRALQNSFAPGGANIAESKSTIDVVVDRVYMAAGDEGTKVVSLSSGEILHEVPRVTLDGIDPSLTVTNAVTVSNELLLMANGEAGTYLAQIDGDTLRNAGYIHFGTSSNYVVAEGDLIFISSGAGGFKVVEAVYYNPQQGSYLTVCSEWDSRGVPDCLLDPCTLPDGLSDRIETRFPNRRDFPGDNSELFDASAVQQLVFTDTTSLSVCFFDDKTGWTNSFGYYTYPVDSPPQSQDDLSDMTVVFPNVSSTQGGGGLEQGDHLDIGPFEAGTVVGFFLVAQGWHAGDVSEGRYTHVSDINLNGEGIQQHVLLHDEASGALVLSWEDAARTSPRQQTDFNDVQLILDLSNSSAVDVSGIPSL